MRSRTTLSTSLGSVSHRSEAPCQLCSARPATGLWRSLRLCSRCSLRRTSSMWKSSPVCLHGCIRHASSRPPCRHFCVQPISVSAPLCSTDTFGRISQACPMPKLKLCVPGPKFKQCATTAPWGPLSVHLSSSPAHLHACAVPLLRVAWRFMCGAVSLHVRCCLLLLGMMGLPECHPNLDTCTVKYRLWPWPVSNRLMLTPLFNTSASCS